MRRSGRTGWLWTGTGRGAGTNGAPPRTILPSIGKLLEAQAKHGQARKTALGNRRSRDAPKRRNPPKRVPKVSRGLDMGCTRAQAEVAKSSGCEFTTPACSVNTVPFRSELPPDFAVRGTSVCGRVTSAPLRKANGQALPMGCPSLTSRGRQLAGGAEVLIRTSTDEGRVGRRYGIRMKSMTTDLDLSLPSLRVPATGGSKEAACLMAKGDVWLSSI